MGGVAMYCSNCGTKLADNMKFCPNCRQANKPLDAEERSKAPPPDNCGNVPSPQGKQRSLIALRTIQAIVSIGVFLLLLFCAYKLFCNALDINFFSFS